MTTTYFPTTSEIALVFSDEISALGGSVSDRYDDGHCLFMRAQLAAERDVTPGDTLKGGIALRTVGPVVSVHPYVFRKICSNGAIAAQVTGTRKIRRVEFESATEFVTAATEELRFTVRRCAEPAVFEKTAEDMASTRHVMAEAMIQMLPILERVPVDYREHIISMLGREFAEGNDGTYYGVMNAITAVARETPDPETKWQLEAFGGSIPALARRAMRKVVEREEELLAL
jgi:hypothetical protein